jgi:hypothetical protein
MTTPLERVETLAVEVFGYAAAVSIDRAENRGPRSADTVVRIWDKAGVEVLRGEPASRTEALAAMREKLERRLFLGEE